MVTFIVQFLPRKASNSSFDFQQNRDNLTFNSMCWAVYAKKYLTLIRNVDERPLILLVIGLRKLVCSKDISLTFNGKTNIFYFSPSVSLFILKSYERLFHVKYLFNQNSLIIFHTINSISNS